MVGRSRSSEHLSSYPLLLIASLLLVVRPRAPSSVLPPSLVQTRLGNDVAALEQRLISELRVRKRSNESVFAMSRTRKARQTFFACNSDGLQPKKQWPPT